MLWSCALALACATASASSVGTESGSTAPSSSLEHLRGFQVQRPAQKDEVVPVLLGVQQLNLDQLERTLYAVSDPTGAQYGQYLTLEEVDALTGNPAAVEAVTSWLRTHQFFDVQMVGQHYIRASATVATLERELDADYHVYSRCNDWSPSDGEKGNTMCAENDALSLLRSSTYTLPSVLAPHVALVSHVADFPPARHSAVKVTGHLQDGTTVYPGGNTTIALLNSFYNVDDNQAKNANATQCVFGIGQQWDPVDLAQFHADNHLPGDLPNVTLQGEPIFPYECKNNPNMCLEASLDLQSMTSMAQYAPTSFWNEDCNAQYYFWDWLTQVSAEADPPLVISMSYDQNEKEDHYGHNPMFSVEAQKLGVRGVTILAASGDDGIASYGVRSNAALCAFNPTFPSGSPFVTSVGATYGPEHDSGDRTEIACTSNGPEGGGLITTGGGFSTQFARPAYQAGVVEAFLNSSSTLPPLSEFNASGRGYPDVSVLGHNYPTLDGGHYYQVSGTSASTPIFAGMVTLINSARLDKGLPSVGFLNPALYQLYSTIPDVFNDITTGENNCCAAVSDPVCCPHGFTAQKGWDPTTGLGSINFAKLKAAMLAMAEKK